MATFTGTFFPDAFVGSDTANNFYNFATGTLTSADTLNGGDLVDFVYLLGPHTLTSGAFLNFTGIEQLVFDNFNTSVVLRSSMFAPSFYTMPIYPYVFRVTGGTANDTMDASGVLSTSPIQLLGNAGIDTFYGGAGNGSQYVGGSGNDTFTMGTGTEYADGGDDNDVFSGTLAQLSGDEFFGGIGNDTLNILAAGGLTITVKGIETINLAAGTNNISIFSRVLFNSTSTINGSTGNDTVTITSIDSVTTEDPENFIIIGGAGDDNLTGGDGNDILRGQNNNDILVGGDGNDTLDGGNAIDILSGGDGDDIYDNVQTNDTIIELTSDGTDTIRTALTNYTMAGNVEFLDYTGTVAVQFFGNAIGNTIEGSNLVDIIEGRDGGDTLNGLDGIDTLRGEGGDDTLNGQGDRDFLYGGINNDTLNGGAGDDELYGDENDDTLNGGIDNDDLFGGEGIDTLNGEDNRDFLYGGAGNDILKGGNGDDELYGEEDDDTLQGGAGEDVINGGSGIDTADYSTSTGPVSFDLRNPIDFADAGNGKDSVREVEVFVGSSFDDYFIGDGENNTFYGGNGHDVVDYSAEVNGLQTFGETVDYFLVLNSPAVGDPFSIGGDKFYYVEEFYGSQADDYIGGLSIAHGLGGNDTFFGTGSTNTFIGDGGSDTVVYGDFNYLDELLLVDLADSSRNLDAAFGDTLTGIENLTYSGSHGAELFGNHLDNVISLIGQNAYNAAYGRDGNDRFISGVSRDFIVGDGGIDTVDYSGSNAAVTVNLITGDGSGGTADFDDYLDIENITGSTFADILTGSTVDNTIVGGVGGDTLDGGANTAIGDTLNYEKSSAAVTVNLALNTASGGDAQGDVISNFENITGSAYNDRLTGGIGINVLRGGNGNDLIYVDTAGDIVIEGANGGTADRVLTSVNYTLGIDQQIELFSTTDSLGTTAINLTGNNLADVILGNNGSNRLDGGGGIDRMTGQNGDDFYYVDNALDTVIEVAGGGTGDRVLTTVNYTLAVDQQVELLSTTDSLGTLAINLTGNNLANTILGNNGANIITGGGGADRMTGLNGIDQYFVDNALDTVVEIANGGIADRVYTTVDYTLGVDQQIELFTTTNSGLTAAINLTGNNVANVIVGNNGVNIINGGLANDALTGGGAADKFLFNTAITGGANVDTITDFLHATDDIQLAQSIFTNIGGTLNANELRLGTSATLSTERLVYDSVTGNLFFDADGSGATAQLQFAKVTAGTVLDINDFIMV